MRDAVSMTQMRDKFVLPVSIGGQSVCSFEWQLYYERPDDLVFNGPEAGTNGANLGVAVDYRDPLRFIYKVASGGAVPYLAVVERADAPLFHIVSRGAPGESGSAGSDGATGSSGSECGDGGPGGNGGDGGDGGRGGNGGDIAVNIACGAASCPDVVALLRQTIVSVAGPGGSGGPGGNGGAGGSGGSGRSPTTHTDSDGNTVTDDPGCSAGSDGSSGSSGSPGADGPPGQPGHTRFVVVPPKS